jgi:gamma-glutamylaminecyclotransferase
MTHVFVYGTLKHGFGNHRALLRDATFVGKGTTILPFVMRSNGGFPVVLRHRADETGLAHNISGEIYEVDDTVLRQLDGLEGHPNWYEREEVAVDVADTGVQQSCWMYIGTHFRQPHEMTLCPVDASGAYVWGSEPQFGLKEARA